MKINNIKKKEITRFLFGGGSAVIVDYLTYQWLMSMGLDMNIAKAIYFVCGAIIGFIINKFWTFESRSFLKGEIVRYVVLYACTAFINAFVNKMLIILASVEILGFLCATAVSTILNFMGQKYFVFQKPGDGGI